MVIKAIIFDCFGVLVGRGFDDTYASAGGDPVRDKQFIHDTLHQASRGHITQADFRRSIAEKLHISEDEWNEAVRQAEQPNQKLLDYIRQLKRSYKTAILSNVNSGVLERKLNPSVLKNDFDVVVESAEVGYMKPEPAIYHHAAEELGVTPEECVFIDDNESFVEAAKAGGMQGLVYTDFINLQRDLEKLLADTDA